MLLRHAKAEPWSPGVDDFTRALAPRGIEHMHQLTTWLQASNLIVDIALCSSSTRTRQTIAPLFTAWPLLQSSTNYQDELYAASAGTLTHMAESAFAQHDSVLMIGHNPGFETLALGLMSNEDRNSIYKMPTGTLGVFTFDKGFAVDFPSGRLDHWVSRKSLSSD